MGANPRARCFVLLLWVLGALGPLRDAVASNSRVPTGPLHRVLLSEALEPDLRQKLELVTALRDWADSQGFVLRRTYGRIGAEHRHVLYVVVACDPLSFTPRTRWVPGQGHLVWFTTPSSTKALAQAGQWERDGDDVHMREAPAWTALTIGSPPLLPHMLAWAPGELAATLIHELVHQTVWFPADEAFSESLATFIGNAASDEFLAHVLGGQGAALRDAQAERAELDRWHQVLRETHGLLDAIYTDAALSLDDKLHAKSRVFATLPRRVAGAGFAHPERFIAEAQRGRWNNARMLEHQSYTNHDELFSAVLQRCGAVAPMLSALADLSRRRPRAPPVAVLQQLLDDGALCSNL